MIIFKDVTKPSEPYYRQKGSLVCSPFPNTKSSRQGECVSTTEGAKSSALDFEESLLYGVRSKQSRSKAPLGRGLREMQVESHVGKHMQAGLRVPTCPLTCTHHVCNARVPSALLRVSQPPCSLAAVLMSVYKFPRWGWGSPYSSGLCMYILQSLSSFPLCSAYPLTPDLICLV